LTWIRYLKKSIKISGLQNCRAISIRLKMDITTFPNSIAFAVTIKELMKIINCIVYTATVLKKRKPKKGTAGQNAIRV